MNQTPPEHVKKSGILYTLDGWHREFDYVTVGILLFDLMLFPSLESKNSNAKYHVLECKFSLQSSRLTMRIPEEKNSLMAL